MSRVTHLLLVSAIMALPAAAVQARPDQAPSVVAGGSAAPSLPGEDDTTKNQPNLAERLLVAPREPRCVEDGTVGGIAVCGKKVDPNKNRLPIPTELNSATALNTGMPSAPDVMGNRIKGRSIGLGCFLGPCPPAMMPNIDFSMMPPDPAGSDAERIGKGEIRGN